ncbi:MAG: indolepyruvate ferredoxin oxidoreductase subunit alpha [Oscillospiraceae bacterium]|jgi:indolepyruvate ferredoxin oxidoreductase alpha subunit|nr:indolepyruvate ferredoxin oxidoreductase subunit alpha [Oscillospiraceae bacterium]
MSKQILSGNEAVARGAWEAGVRVAAAYPGTPSTEILENIAEYKDDLYATWANNEAIAAELAFGAAVGGMRSLTAMKHVGMNVAADPIFSGAYAGINGGMMIVSADDPGCHSSQNEQDNRLYAEHAKLIMLEPSDSQECLDFTKAAYELSEKYDMLALLRMTTRVCHSKSVVETGERTAPEIKPYNGDWTKYVVLPVNARRRHILLEQSIAKLREEGYSSPLNRIEMNEGATVGVISSGVSYQHAREAFGDTVSYLKLGITFPICGKLVKEFAAKFGKVVVIEEGEPYLSTRIKAMGVAAEAPDFIQGELNAAHIRAAFGIAEPGEKVDVSGLQDAPARPPVLCAGCPHRGFFYALSKRKGKFVGVGDIGCYTLGVNPPFNGMDICICMGSGFAIPIGLSRALEAQGDTRRVFGFVGDSTFFHSGFNSLVDAVHQKSNVCLVVLDNSITAMTGHQENAHTEKNLQGYQVPAIPIEKMVLATGLAPERLIEADPVDQDAIGRAIDAGIANEGVTVIITRRPCVLLKEEIKARGTKHCEVSAEKCVGCKACMKIACPALAFDEAQKKAYVADTANCTACGLCKQMCKVGAIGEVQ